MVIQSLNGSWRCFVTDYAVHAYTVEGLVPGCVHTDLQRAGIIGDIFYRDHAESVQWIENCDVTYTKTFIMGTVNPNTWLVFAGVDVYAGVYLNGKELGQTDDMFHPWEYDVSNTLKAGENTIEVRFRSPVREVEGLPVREAAFTAERLYTRRMQCTYGWDWVARLVTMGIFRDVWLEQRQENRLDNAYVYTKNINPYTAQISIQMDFADVTGDSWVYVTITDPQGYTVYNRRRRILDERLTITVDISSPQLWYPSGYGNQPLYTLQIVSAREQRKISFGIRTIVVLESPDKPDSDEWKLAQRIKQYPHLQEWDANEVSSGFILLVNDVRIFCKGANWVPAEPFPSAESDEKLEKLVDMARLAGCNMLRVWGGGIVEKDSFYTACDRLGILVTHDFFMACGHYPEEDDNFIEKLKQETVAIALRLRNHPCLVWWSGDNENAVRGNENNPSYWGRRAALKGIAPILEKWDPMRIFFPSSPYGGEPYASAVVGTTHNTQYLDLLFNYIQQGDFSDYRHFFEQYLARFVAEQPAMGLPFVSSLQKFMTNEDIFGENTAMLEYHTKNNPCLEKITLYGYIDRLVRGIFGDYRNGHDRVIKMQMLHCEWIRLSMELFRRHQWFSSGLLYWMFNDCWPAANGWSIVDYYTNPKPGFYAFRRCAAPLLASLVCEEGEFRVYLSNHTLREETVSISLYCYHLLTGEEFPLCQREVRTAANNTICVVCISEEKLSSQTVLLCDISSSLGYDRAVYLPETPGSMAFTYAYPLIVEEDEKTLTIETEETLLYAIVDVPYVLEANCFFMKKGERRILQKLAILTD